MTEHKTQKGAVLVVSLVLLTVLTLIGVASMRSASLEMRVASNAQQRNIAFQAAQSRLDFISSTDTANPINFKIAVPNPENPATWPAHDQGCNSSDGCSDGATWAATAQVAFGGCGESPGSSMEDNKAFKIRFFNITATGKTDNDSAYSTQAQGLRIPVAGC